MGGGYGVPYGQFSKVTLAYNELITQATFSWSDSVICSLFFRTNVRTYGPFTATDCRGSNSYTVTMSRLLAFVVQSDTEINAIGLIYVA